MSTEQQLARHVSDRYGFSVRDISLTRDLVRLRYVVHIYLNGYTYPITFTVDEEDAYRSKDIVGAFLDGLDVAFRLNGIYKQPASSFRIRLAHNFEDVLKSTSVRLDTTHEPCDGTHPPDPNLDELIGATFVMVMTDRGYVVPLTPHESMPYFTHKQEPTVGATMLSYKYAVLLIRHRKEVKMWRIHMDRSVSTVGVAMYPDMRPRSMAGLENGENIPMRITEVDCIRVRGVEQVLDAARMDINRVDMDDKTYHLLNSMICGASPYAGRRMVYPPNYYIPDFTKVTAS